MEKVRVKEIYFWRFVVVAVADLKSKFEKERIVFD